MRIERLSIRKMQVLQPRSQGLSSSRPSERRETRLSSLAWAGRRETLGAFPAVLDDLNFKFSRGSMPDPTCMFMLYRSVQFIQKQGYKKDYRQITSPFIRI